MEPRPAHPPAPSTTNAAKGQYSIPPQQDKVGPEQSAAPGATSFAYIKRLAADAILGKETGQDDGKPTLPGTRGIEPSRLRMMDELRQADQHLRLALGSRHQTRWLLAELFPHCGLPPRRAIS